MQLFFHRFEFIKPVYYHIWRIFMDKVGGKKDFKRIDSTFNIETNSQHLFLMGLTMLVQSADFAAVNHGTQAFVRVGSKIEPYTIIKLQLQLKQ